MTCFVVKFQFDIEHLFKLCCFFFRLLKYLACCKAAVTVVQLKIYFNFLKQSRRKFSFISFFKISNLVCIFLIMTEQRINISQDKRRYDERRRKANRKEMNESSCSLLKIQLQKRIIKSWSIVSFFKLAYSFIPQFKSR